MYVIMCYSLYSVRAASVGATSAICGLNSGGFIGVLATRVQRGITQGQHRLCVKLSQRSRLEARVAYSNRCPLLVYADDGL
jgi:hypothetical protein